MPYNPLEIYFAGQLALALILGGVLGWQRERWRRAAGMRTYALVTAGSTLFTILSLHAFGDGDTSKVAAGVVTGIGFLGAGAILHKKEHIEGITTAAGLWITAAIGMAVGAKLLTLAFLTTIFILIVLMIDDKKTKKETAMVKKVENEKEET